MSTSTPVPEASKTPARPALTALEGALLFVLITLAGIELVGYRFGDSNHGITVPILKHYVDPSLYRADAMVATADNFPTVFYRALSAVIPGTEAIPAVFFILYVLSVAAALAGVYRLGRWCGGAEAGVVAMVIAIPVRVGIASEALYRVQFSHSHLASALVIWAMAWFLEGRRLLPLLVLSLGAYNHALYSMYVLVPCLLVVLFEMRKVGLRTTALRAAAGTVPLIPFVVSALAKSAPMTREWLALLRLRSEFHSFPSAFGDSLPAAAFLLALGVLTLSRLDRDKRVVAALFLAGFALQFVLGTVFTEVIPVKAVLQFQPHRCWRFLMVLLYGLAAQGIVAGWRAGGLSRLASAVTGVTLVDVALEPLLPVGVFLQAALGRPAAALWARLVAVGTLACLAGWPGPDLDTEAMQYPIRLLNHPTVVGAAALALLVIAARELAPVVRRVVVVGAAFATLLWLGPEAYGRKRPKWELGAWREVQDWVRENTPKDATLVTPPLETGFRVFSERTIVGEWKDGTQQYFDDGFAREWARRMDALGPKGYPKLTDEQLIAIARRFRADFVVIPPRRRHPGLEELFKNLHYAVYRVPSPGAGRVETR